MNTTRRRPLLASLALLAAALLPAGCGTMLGSGFDGKLSPYNGTAVDFAFAWGSRDPGLKALAALDLPFSLIADTLLLPVSVPMSLAR
jgi:uncharacterized protein YceK